MKEVTELEEFLSKTSGKEKYDILNKLADIYQNISLDKCLDYNLQALELSHKILTKVKKSDIYVKIGDIYREKSEYDKALIYYQTGLELSKNNKNDKKQANFLNHIGEVNFRLSNYDQALEYYLKSLKIREEISDKKGISDSLNTIGNIYYRLKNYNKALEHYQRSLKIRKQLKDDVAIAKSYNNIGNLFSALLDYDKALDYYFKAKELYDKTDNIKEHTSIYNNLGIIYRDKGDNKTALENFLKALKISEDLNMKYNHANTSNETARTYMKLKDYKKAEKYLKIALEQSKEIGSKDVIQESYEIFAELYSQMKEYKKAYESLKEYSKINESVYGELSGNIAEIQSKYISEQKEKEAEIYRLKNVELAKYIKDLTRANDTINKKNKELTEAYLKLDILARTDPLTRLSNRRDILDKIKYEALKYERSNESFVVMISDIDNFKGFNDNYGHDCGDFVLVNLANLMRSVLRKQDNIGRWGGEEFIFLMPKTSLEGGMLVAEKIRKKIENEIFYYRDIKLKITMTFGVHVYDRIMDIDYSINKADEALYYGKNTGKNCVKSSEDI